MVLVAIFICHAQLHMMMATRFKCRGDPTGNPTHPASTEQLMLLPTSSDSTEIEHLPCAASPHTCPPSTSAQLILERWPMVGKLVFSKYHLVTTHQWWTPLLCTQISTWPIVNVGYIYLSTSSSPSWPWSSSSSSTHPGFICRGAMWGAPAFSTSQRNISPPSSLS